MNLKPWDTIEASHPDEAAKKDKWVFLAFWREGSSEVFVLRWHLFPYLASAWIAAYIIMVAL